MCELLSARLGRLDLSRHNISRIPELVFFVRKLARDREEALWDLPYSKAGAAAALPEQFASAEDFLSQMQAHTALEFQVCTPGLLPLSSDSKPCGPGSRHLWSRRRGCNQWLTLPAPALAMGPF